MKPLPEADRPVEVGLPGAAVGRLAEEVFQAEAEVLEEAAAAEVGKHHRFQKAFLI